METWKNWMIIIGVIALGFVATLIFDFHSPQAFLFGYVAGLAIRKPVAILAVK